MTGYVARPPMIPSPALRVSDTPGAPWAFFSLGSLSFFSLSFSPSKLLFIEMPQIKKIYKFIYNFLIESVLTTSVVVL